jgi:spore coat polysaccharide biosynthesis protein SpsF
MRFLLKRLGRKSNVPVPRKTQAIMAGVLYIVTVTAIIQARMGSTRLPGKTLMDLAGRPVVMHLVDRARAAQLIDRVIVATSTAATDDILEQALRAAGVLFFRGSQDDVLNRYAEATRALVPEDEWSSGAVVRLTADDPLKDPRVIDAAIAAFLQQPGRWDYVCNNQPPWLPEGQDTEVVAIPALLAADDASDDAYEREHATPYLYRHPERFRCHSLHGSPDLSGCRWTLDTAEDMAFFQAVFAAFPDDPMPSMEKVLALLAAKPEIAALNSEVARSALYRSETGE